MCTSNLPGLKGETWGTLILYLSDLNPPVARMERTGRPRLSIYQSFCVW
jgi:hypothetical protein